LSEQGGSVKVFWVSIIYQCMSLFICQFAYGMMEEGVDYFVCPERGVSQTFLHDSEFEELYQCIISNDLNEFTRLICAKTIKNRKEVFVIDINKRITGVGGETFLIYIVTEGRSYFVEALLKNRPDLDINAQNSSGNTALHRAVLNQDCYLTELLILDDRIDVGIKNNKNHTARYYAKKNKMLKGIFKQNAGCSCIIA
jgi:hypothetical protein